MPTFVPERPSAVILSRLQIGQPVSANVGRHWASELAFLLARNLHVVCNHVYPSTGADESLQENTGATTLRIAYNRAPGAQLLYVEVSIARATDQFGGRMSIAVTASSGTIAQVGEAPRLLDGSRVIPTDTIQRPSYEVHGGFLDVSALTPGTTIDLQFDVTDESIDPVSAAIYQLYVVEVPTRDINPDGAPTTEVGVDLAWASSSPPRELVDGDTSAGGGFVRIFAELDRARKARRYFQIATTEDTTAIFADAPCVWRLLTQTVSNDIEYGHGGSSPTWKFRARHLYTDSGVMQPEACQIRVRHNGTMSSTLRAIVTPVGGAAVNTDITLPATVGWEASTPAALNLPTTGTGQEFTIEFRGWNSTAGTHYISAIGIQSAEP